jgi:AraC family transcriptional activator of pobA
MFSEEIIKYEFKDGLPLEFEIVDVPALMERHRNSMIKPHRTGFYHVFWVRARGTHVVDFSRVVLQENTLLFVDKETVQSFDPQRPLNAKAILFTSSFFVANAADVRFLNETILFNDLGTTSNVQISARNVSAFDALFTLMEMEAGKRKDDYQSKILRSLLYSFLLLAEREKHLQKGVTLKPAADREYLHAFRELLEVNFKSNKQVTFYARALSITERRLNHAIFTTLGKTVKQAIDDRVILEAKRLLAHTSSSIKEIGFTLGFEEPTNFIKYFRKHTSCTPVEFRQSILQVPA